jgi:hypothetical protein
MGFIEFGEVIEFIEFIRPPGEDKFVICKCCDGAG